MISYLKGTIIAKGSDYIISEAGGVGYKIFVGERRIASFAQGQAAELYCSLYIRKDETLELYGVDSQESLELFETLKGVSGIGPKASLAICSLGTRTRLQEAISKGDASYFSRVHGLGPKKIQKITGIVLCNFEPAVLFSEKQFPIFRRKFVSLFIHIGKFGRVYGPNPCEPLPQNTPH